jgi:hypothetical protein
MVKSGDSFCLRILRFSHFCTLFVPKHHNSLIINAYYFLYRKVMRSWGGAAYLLHDIAFGKIYHIALRPEMPALARGFYMQPPRPRRNDRSGLSNELLHFPRDTNHASFIQHH